MSTFMFSVRRRDLAWGVALIVLLSAIWIARSDFADAGVVPTGDGIAVVYVAVSTNSPTLWESDQELAETPPPSSSCPPTPSPSVGSRVGALDPRR
jgi:hypothetical protein